MDNRTNNRLAVLRMTGLGLVLMSLLWACGHREVQSKAELRAYLSDPENGLVATRQYPQVNWELNLGLGYPEGMASSTEADDRSLHFNLRVSPGGGAAGDVMMAGVAGYGDYATRMEQLNFGMEEMVELRAGSLRLRPVLSHMENTFGLTEDRKLHLVFASPDLPARMQDLPGLDLVLEDRVFGTGINHFQFQQSALAAIPEVRDANQQ